MAAVVAVVARADRRGGRRSFWLGDRGYLAALRRLWVAAAYRYRAGLGRRDRSDPDYRSRSLGADGRARSAQAGDSVQHRDYGHRLDRRERDVCRAVRFGACRCVLVRDAADLAGPGRSFGFAPRLLRIGLADLILGDDWRRLGCGAGIRRCGAGSGVYPARRRGSGYRRNALTLLVRLR